MKTPYYPCPPPNCYVALKLLPLKMVEDLGLDEQARQEAHRLQDASVWHLVYLNDLERFHVPKARWHTYMGNIITSMDAVNPSEVVATIFPNSDCPGADSETTVAFPEPPIARYDGVVTAYSCVTLRILTGKSVKFPVKDVVNETRVMAFPTGYMDSAGVYRVAAFARPAIYDLLACSTTNGDLKPDAPVDDLAHLYFNIIKAQDLVKAVRRDDDIMYREGEEDVSRHPEDDLFGFGIDPDGPLLALTEVSLDINKHFPPDVKLTTPEDFHAEIQAVRSVIVRAIQRKHDEYERSCA